MGLLNATADMFSMKTKLIANAIPTQLHQQALHFASSGDHEALYQLLLFLNENNLPDDIFDVMLTLAAKRYHKALRYIVERWDDQWRTKINAEGDELPGEKPRRLERRPS
jgi:hypothetical protein